MGIDGGGLGRESQGRSDTTMVVTINPETKKVTIMSIQRDIYSYRDGPKSNKCVGFLDKINHAWAFGKQELSVATVQKLLDCPIEHYIAINLDGMRDLVDAIGGIDVDNKLGDFTVTDCEQDYGEVYQATIKHGKQHLDGKHALAYARMRYNDPKQDIGRNQRQRVVLKLIVEKTNSIGSLPKFKRILKAVDRNVKTDLSFDDLKAIRSGYRQFWEEDNFENIDQIELQGPGDEHLGAYYQFLPQATVLKAQNHMRKQMNLPPKKEIGDSQIPTYESIYNQPYNGEELEFFVHKDQDKKDKK
jgi:LCP family protein required for cell wall assembly